MIWPDPPAMLRRLFLMKKEVKVTSGIDTLFGTRDENLRLLESGLHLTLQLKNDAIEIDGETAEVERMERLLQDYGQLMREGVTFSNGDLRGYLKIVVDDASASLH